MKHSKNTNIFMTNRHDGDTVYNPITNKMVKRDGKIGKMLTSRYKYIFSGGTVNIPFISNETFWETTPSGDSVYKCNKECFPFDISSHIPCLPRCLYTDIKGPDPLYTFFEKNPNKNKKRLSPKLIIVTYGLSLSNKLNLGNFFLNYLQINEQDLMNVNADFILKNEQFEIGQEFRNQVNSIKQTYPKDKHNTYIIRLKNYYKWVAYQLEEMLLTHAMNEDYSFKWDAPFNVDISLLKNWIQDKINNNYHVIIVYSFFSYENINERLMILEREAQHETGYTKGKIIELIDEANRKFEELKNTYSKQPNTRLLQIDNNENIIYESNPPSNNYFCVIS